MKIADMYNIPVIETSAKQSQNVEEAFLQIIKEAVRLQSDKDIPSKNGKKSGSLKEGETILISGPQGSPQKENNKKEGSCC